MQSLIPNLGVENIAQTVAYYQNHFGFALQMAVNDKHETTDTLKAEDRYLWAMIQNGGVTLMLQQQKSLKEDVGDFFQTLGASATFYINVENADTLYESIKDHVEVMKAPSTSWYGQREFYVKDLNGYVLGFASSMSK